MTISLYDAVIPSKLQVLRAGLGWLDKAAESGLPEEEIAEARLIEDMLPFAYQVKSMSVHSAGAIEGVRAGVFEPDMSDPPQTIAGMRSRLEDAIAALEAVTPEEMSGFIGRDARFEVARFDIRLEFTAEQFLLTFSQPNFYFHASTAYDILRMKGVPLGKRGFLGTLRLKG